MSHLSSNNLINRTIFGEYIIKQKLGEGGMGAVYLAEQRSIGQKIAIKVLHGQASENDELVKRFNREAKAISMLTHPNIIRVFIFGKTEDGLIYLAMEYIDGTSLRRELSQKGPMPEKRAILILKQVLSALSEAHNIGIIHRDLKPDNILLTTYRGQKDFVKVLDFGIAKVKEPNGQDAQLTQAGMVYGTPEYLSPEQAQAKPLDKRTDVYSLGIILYEMLTGNVPFKANTAVQILMQHVHKAPPAPSSIVDLSPSMEKIILKAIAKNPDERYQSTEEFLEDLVKREQEMIKEGQQVHQIRMPGQDVTQAFLIPEDLAARAKAVLQGQSTPPATPTPPPSQIKTLHGQFRPTPHRSKTPMVLIIAIVLLSLLLIMVGILIVVLQSR